MLNLQQQQKIETKYEITNAVPKRLVKEGSNQRKYMQWDGHYLQNLFSSNFHWLLMAFACKSTRLKSWWSSKECPKSRQEMSILEILSSKIYQLKEAPSFEMWKYIKPLNQPLSIESRTSCGFPIQTSAATLPLINNEYPFRDMLLKSIRASEARETI